MRTRRHPRERTGLLPFGSVAATAAASPPRFRPVLAFPVLPLPERIANVRALVRSRRMGLYWDVAGAGFFMALFVAAAILT